jgi:predicted ATPase
VSAPERPAYELVGVSVYGPLPLGRVHVRLSAGVTALYGVNGAGKSRLLAGVQQALQGFGTKGPVQSVLHLRVSDPNAPLADGFLYGLRAAAAEELSEHRETLFHPTYGRYEELGDLWEADEWERAALTGMVRGQSLAQLGGLLFDTVFDDAQ